MSVRILSEADVHRLLPMDECIAAMEGALAALARDQLFNPLRFVIRPPGEETLIGLMPAHRSGARSLYALKTICIAPANAKLGLDLHQGFVALFDGVTGQTRVLMSASAITLIRTAAVSGVATKLLARPESRTLAILGAGTQARSHLEAMRAVLPFDEVRAWSRTAGRAAELDGVVEVGSAEEAVRGADVVVTATTAREPIVRREWLSEGTHVNAVGSSIPSTRELDTETIVDAALFVDRRESTVNEAGDYLLPLREGAIGPEHIRAELGEILIGAAEGRRNGRELTVFKSLGLAVEDLAAAEHVLARAEAESVGVEVELIPYDEILLARETIAGLVTRTPLVRLEAGSDAELYLKLETLQPVNSFKLRGAGNAVLQASEEALAAGVVTASAGNMAQGVAYAARLRGVAATIIVPEGAPQTKVAAVERFGGTVVKLPYDEWWRVLVEGHYEGSDGLFVHPVDDPKVMAGNGTIGLELLEDLPDLDAVIVPYGGGGLIAGIASAVKATRPEVRFYAVEPVTGAPLRASLDAGHPVEVDYQRSFVDGAGSRSLILPVWEQHARELIDDAFTVSLEQTAAAVRLIAERLRVIAEGAGALSTAAALSGVAGGGKIVCIVSGGNIDPLVFGRILAGETP